MSSNAHQVASLYNGGPPGIIYELYVLTSSLP